MTAFCLSCFQPTTSQKGINSAECSTMHTPNKMRLISAMQLCSKGCDKIELVCASQLRLPCNKVKMKMNRHCDTGVTVKVLSMNWHNGARTKLLTFCRWHFQMHFIKWKKCISNKIHCHSSDPNSPGKIQFANTEKYLLNKIWPNICKRY